jgi:SagB-type dehydrogenase family enzyme
MTPCGGQDGPDRDCLGEHRAACASILAYHERSKHHFDRYARSLGVMDWANQPNPFRYYEGSRQTPLDPHGKARALAYGRLYEPNALSPLPLDLDSLGVFFRYGMAISAWKAAGGSRWALRVNPSSGNLHPTETYALLPPLTGLAERAGLYHYVSETHVLERRATLSDDLWHALSGSLTAGSFLVGLSSIAWREAWKYGERAFRYCQHDLGHAVAALRFSAVLCGWKLTLLTSWSTADIAALLGLDRNGEFYEQEHEEAEALAIVTPNGVDSVKAPLPPDAQLLASIRAADWSGRANRLSEAHHAWPIIDEANLVTRKTRVLQKTAVMRADAAAMASGEDAGSDPDAAQIILQRRSGLGFDGTSAIAREAFLRLLARTLPGICAPWDALPWPAKVHLVLFVHRVSELVPGVYVLVRDPSRTELLRRAMQSDFAWQAVSSDPTSMPLYLLFEADTRDTARVISCHQEIAADGFFSLGMLAEFADPIREQGAWFYRHLFWEAGVVGQVLYLEAEAVGARSTGIGCYFDDAVHNVLGLHNSRFQSLYHFTVGMPVEDRRLQTLPPYPDGVQPP